MAGPTGHQVEELGVLSGEKGATWVCEQRRFMERPPRASVWVEGCVEASPSSTKAALAHPTDPGPTQRLHTR